MSTIDILFPDSSTAYWAVAQLQPSRTALALNLLTQEGFTVYAPKIRERRVIRGRRTKVISALFPGYAFVRIALQWHAACWCLGVVRLVMDGLRPAKVPEMAIKDIRDRERGGFIELPWRGPKRGDRGRILSGPFPGHLAVYAGMSGRERVAILLEILGGQPRATIPLCGIEVPTGGCDELNSRNMVRAITTPAPHGVAIAEAGRMRG
jgi:transcriptional antiterminator RfaH